MKKLINSIYLPLFIAIFCQSLSANEIPDLPSVDGDLMIPAQEWPQKPGPRKVKIYIHYPGRKLSNVNSQTGIMLNLHSWGGVYHSFTAQPERLSDRYNVISICVDYLQTGPKWKTVAPYDYGYLQSLDALRALYFVFNGLKTSEIPYASDRIYCTGGSGGGNLTLMTNKLAPRTFALSIDKCGMAKLSDDIAYGLPGGSSLNAGFTKDSTKPNYLSPDRQQLHYVGDPQHLQVMKQLGTQNKMIVVHGKTDVACTFKDAKEMVDNMLAAKLDVEPFFIGDEEVDGKIFTSTGHGLGDVNLIVFKYGDPYLMVDGKKARRLKEPTDFERKETVIYPTANGAFEISYEKGFPVGRFVSKSK